jgi:heat shock protein HslJ
MKKLSLAIILVVVAVISVSLAGCSGGAADLEDIKWILTSYGPEGSLKSPLPDSQVTVTFKSETKEATGNAGCNHYGGGYNVKGDKLTMEGPFGVTEMWCGEEKDAQEKEYLDILLAAESYDVDGDTLVIDCGANVLNFERE